MSNKSPTFAALIVAAGSGQRCGGELPKQFRPLLGRPVYRWSIEAFEKHPRISKVFVVVPAGQAGGISGGATRQESVRLGLEAIAADKDKPDYILIHDAARPCVSTALISRICDAAIASGAAIPGLPVTDTLKRAAEGNVSTESRENLYAVQTPQAFGFDLIFGLHQEYKDKSLTDDAALCELAGHAVTIVEGDKNNIKITYPEDFAEAERLLALDRGDIRTGKGYDVHRLVAPQHDLHKLKLGGIDIPHDKALEGHSDADVVLHAVTDALLATICDGDIGMHFSPKDSRWKNADSAAFLRHAADLIRAQNGLITHIDVNVICEEPKIGPHRDKMRARIGEILDLSPQRVSVKATTTEGLGFTGRGEGIVAEAVATVRLPFATPAAEQEKEIRHVRHG